MTVFHLIFGARGESRLVHDDEDRVAILRRVRIHLGRPMLAHCLLDTHGHFVVEGELERVRAELEMAFRIYARSFNARHGDEVFLRGPVTAIPAPSERELARMIAYVHENPVPPRLVAKPIHFEWSSARDYGGLSRAGLTDVARARVLIGREHAWRVKLEAPALADLEPGRVPCASPELLLAATAQTYGLLPSELAGSGRKPILFRARGVYARLGRLESYHGAQLAPALDLTRQRISQLASGEVDDLGVRIARTIVSTPELRARLRPSANFPGWKIQAVHSG
jgi:hypothetical protein